MSMNLSCPYSNSGGDGESYSAHLDVMSAELLQELAALGAYTPGKDDAVYPLVKCRPLGAFSDFVAEDLGEMYDDVLAGTLMPMDLLDLVEERASSVGRLVVPELLSRPDSREAEVAVLDIAWAERFVNVAFDDRETFHVKRNATRFFSMGRHLATAIGRYPVLQWTDIAENYPSNDPRTFLSSGYDRLQEIHLYRVQRAIERGSQRIVQHWLGGHPDRAAQRDILETCGRIAKAMANLSRKRQPGEFEKLDRFLSPNDEVVGHATGSFSGWTKLAGFLCTGRPDMLGSVTLADNLHAFDPRTRPWIAAIADGRTRPLDAAQDELGEAISRRCTHFHMVHLAAVKRHAPGALRCPAPAMRSITNHESMNRNIKDVGT